jgi:hypothetical protein
MNRFNSIFRPNSTFFSRREFFETFYATQAERGAKGFSRWDQVVAVILPRNGIEE